MGAVYATTSFRNTLPSSWWRRIPNRLCPVPLRVERQILANLEHPTSRAYSMAEPRKEECHIS